jgi:hypothetical protein
MEMAQVSGLKPSHFSCPYQLYTTGRSRQTQVQPTNPRRVMNIKNPIFLTAGAFLSAWAASNFDVDYRAILWAVLAGVFGYATPKK